MVVIVLFCSAVGSLLVSQDRSLIVRKLQDGSPIGGRFPVGLRLVQPARLTQDRYTDEEEDEDEETVQDGSVAVRGARLDLRDRRSQHYGYLVSPISSQPISVDRSVGNQLISLVSRPKTTVLASAKCRAIKTSTRFVKDEADPIDGRIVRTCRGEVQVNRCEGRCSSSAEPSARSRLGLNKVSPIRRVCYLDRRQTNNSSWWPLFVDSQNCYCCNEGSFRPVQVRLDECYLVTQSGTLESQPGGFMDLSINEPDECGCRRCDGAP